MPVRSAHTGGSVRRCSVTFVHRFSGGLCCVIHASDEPPADGKSHELNVRWSGVRMKAKYVREYIGFALEVNQILANTWGKRLMYAVETSPARWQFWGFEPAGNPELLKELPV